MFQKKEVDRSNLKLGRKRGRPKTKFDKVGAPTPSVRLKNKIAKLEKAYIMLDYSIKEIAERYGINENMVMIYRARYKWVEKKALWYQAHPDMKEVKVLAKTLRSSDMWQRMREKVEAFVNELEPLEFEEEDGEIKKKLNPYFLKDMNACKSILKEVRQMERLEDDQPTITEKRIIETGEKEHKPFLTIIDGTISDGNNSPQISDGNSEEQSQVYTGSSGSSKWEDNDRSNQASE